MDYFRQEQVETIAQFQDQLDSEGEMDTANTNYGIEYVTDILKLLFAFCV